MLLLALAFAPPAPRAPVDPRIVADLYRPGEERVWVFEQDGKRIGDHAFRYEGTVEVPGRSLHRFTGRVRIDAMPAAGLPEQRYLGELFTDDAGRPLRSVLEATLGESYSRVELSFAAGKASALVVQGPARNELSIDVPEEAFLQANNFIGYHELTVALGLRAQLFSSNRLQVIPYRAKPDEGKLEDSLGERISLAGDGRIREIEIPGQKLRIASIRTPSTSSVPTPRRSPPTSTSSPSWCATATSYSPARSPVPRE
jgi:hypothetical protein